MDSSNDAVEMIRRMMVSDIGNLSSVYGNYNFNNKSKDHISFIINDEL